MHSGVLRSQGIYVCLWLAAVSTVCGWQAESSIEQALTRIQQSLQRGDTQAARADLIQARTQFPRDPRILNFWGVLEAMDKNFASAESSFEQAIRSAPKFTGAYLNLGRLYQQQPNQPQSLEKALGTYQRLLAVEPGHVEATYQAARLLNQLGRYSQSQQRLESLPPASQQRAAALALRCSNSVALNMKAEADSAAERLLASTDLSAADVLEILPTLSSHGQSDLAARLLQGVNQRGLASAATWSQLSKLYEEHGQFKEARSALENNLKEGTASAALLVTLARLAYRSGDLEGTLGYLAHARDLEPQNAAIHFFFGMVCIDLKLPPEAKKSLLEALRLNPANPEYHYALAAVLLNEKNAEEAIPHFQEYRRAHPDDPRGGFALGVAFYEAYKLAEAKAALSAVAGQPVTLMGAELYLAKVALREENLDEAQIHLQKAMRAKVQSPELYAESALVHIRRSEYPLAEDDLKKALKMAPDHYLSNLRLSMLYQRTRDPRAAAQAKRVEQLQKAGEDKERLLLRSLEIRPY